MKKHTLLAFFLVISSTIFAAPSSVTDEESYVSYCKMATQFDPLFEHFRSSPDFVRVMEHVSYDQGLAFVDYITYNYPYLLEFLDDFRINDSIGSPRVHTYGIFGPFAPTTLRYIKIAGDLLAHFGTLDGKKVVEIGGGYGGQCSILSTLCSLKEYVLIDLPEVLGLAKKYLESLGVYNVTYIPYNELNELTDCDLIISNYAFSECSLPVQQRYLEDIIAHTPQGYMICNQVYGAFTPPALAPHELSAQLTRYGHHVQLFDEEPNTYPTNYIITWGQ